ncbi:MAG: hypothetical protein LBT92_00920 [Rickettsiales bacterium]|jgi:hypothetical protein|nr:hypothetical protein [Rickettsiales bacterium]
MSTSNALLTGFDLAKNTVDKKAEKAKSDAEAKARLDSEAAKDAIDSEKIRAKVSLFARDRTNLLNAKVAANRARMAASGLDGTSNSIRAFFAALQSAANEEISGNAYFADLDLAKYDLNDPSAVSSILAAAQGKSKKKKVVGF